MLSSIPFSLSLSLSGVVGVDFMHYIRIISVPVGDLLLWISVTIFIAH